jgi:alpha-1,3/alpha-1,6-mannosyltransferase
LKDPVPEIWAESLIEIVSLAPADRQALGVSAKKRAKDIFSMEAMAKGLEEALKDAEGMGMVDNGSFELLRVVFVVIAGFLLAYLGGPYLIQK